MADAGRSRVSGSAPGDEAMPVPSVEVHPDLRHDPVDTTSRRLLTAASFFAGDPKRIALLVNRFREREQILESTVRGWSMTESLPDGSRIRIQCRRPHGLLPGQVVAILVKDKLIVHRIAHVGRRRKAKRFLIAHGDSVLLPDHPIEVEKIMGTVLETETPVGWMPVPQPSARPRWRRLRSFLARALGATMELDPYLARAVSYGLWYCKAGTDRLAIGIVRFATLTRQAAHAISGE